jgi:hypothetical protein
MQELEELLVFDGVEWLCEAIRSHVGGRDVIDCYPVHLDSLFDPFVVGVNMLCTFVMSILVS